MLEFRVILSRFDTFTTFQRPLLASLADFLLSSPLLSPYFMPIVDFLRSMEPSGLKDELIAIMTQKIQALEGGNSSFVDREEVSDDSGILMAIDHVSKESPLFIRLAYVSMQLSSSTYPFRKNHWCRSLLESSLSSSTSRLLEIALFCIEIFSSRRYILNEEVAKDTLVSAHPFLSAIMAYFFRPSLDERERVQYWMAVDIMKKLRDPVEKDICSMISLIASEPSWRFSINHFRRLCIHLFDRLEVWKGLYHPILLQKFVSCLVAEMSHNHHVLESTSLIRKFSKRPSFYDDSMASRMLSERFLSSSVYPPIDEGQISAWGNNDLISHLLCTYIRKSGS
jgi:hypothetical protein